MGVSILEGGGNHLEIRLGVSWFESTEGKDSHIIGGSVGVPCGWSVVHTDQSWEEIDGTGEALW